MLVGREESAGPTWPISAVLSHRYCAKKFAFFDHGHDSHLIDIFYHCDSCCHEVELWGVEILKMENACVQIWRDFIFFQIIVPDYRLQFWIRDYNVSLYLSQKLIARRRNSYAWSLSPSRRWREDPVQTIRVVLGPYSLYLAKLTKSTRTSWFFKSTASNFEISTKVKSDLKILDIKNYFSRRCDAINNI